MERDVREAVDYLAVRRLQDAYADVVTRRAWPELVELFRPDCEVVLDTRSGDLVTMVGPTAVGEFIAHAIARFSYFQFVVLGTRVVLAEETPDAATARLYLCEIRQGVDDGRGSVVFGVYHDDYVRLDGTWWFARRQYHSLARTSPDLFVFPFPDVTPGTVG